MAAVIVAFLRRSFAASTVRANAAEIFGELSIAPFRWDKSIAAVTSSFFRRCFAACLKETLPEKDRLWAVDQVMEIESPESVRMLQKTLGGLFHPEAVRRRRREAVSGE